MSLETIAKVREWRAELRGFNRRLEGEVGELSGAAFRALLLIIGDCQEQTRDVLRKEAMRREMDDVRGLFPGF